MHRYLVGTLFEEEEHNKKMNVHTVKAKDPFGNTRWKGAFTGGFQAGFKNTCGSKEGWTPATFVSTVHNRAEKKEQKIFDYMDKEDLGRQSLGNNISLSSNFIHTRKNPLNISNNNSVGEQMLSNMKKKQAFLNAPEDIKELHSLLDNYEKQQILQQQRNYNLTTLLKSNDNYFSVGCRQNAPEDDFIAAYDDFFKKVIRTSIKQQTEEEKTKRIQENRIQFDFTKPLEEQPEYLREIQEVEDISQPKKKRKQNLLHHIKLRDIMKMGKVSLNLDSTSQLTYKVPENYDPYHRLKDIAQKDKKLVQAIEEKAKHKIHSINKRSDLLGQGRINNRFVSATVSSNKFVRSSQEGTKKALEKVFEDDKKNQRYWDYVQELEGKKISAQLQYLDFEEAQKQKAEFQKIYNLKNLKKQKKQIMPLKVQEALKNQNQREVKVVRTTGIWRPQRLLCKRFNCALPYANEKQKEGKQKYF